LDERGKPSQRKKISERAVKRSKHQFLVSWMDGAPPQWVDAKYLQGTPALDEWEIAEEDEAEVFDTDTEVRRKARILAEWLKEAKRPVFMLGAGISAPVLSTFRGKGGLWTRNPVWKAPKRGFPQPTLAHRALVELEKKGFVYFCATQNYDGISPRSGFPADKLSELHGNVYVETCERCCEKYHRSFQVDLSTSTNHETGRFCEKKGCGGALKDNIVHFQEPLPWHALKMANAKFVGADLTIVLGSSLRVEPAASLPFKAKMRRRYGQKPKAVIVNIQKTPRDSNADLVIHAKCDQLMDLISKELLGTKWDAKRNSRRTKRKRKRT